MGCDDSWPTHHGAECRAAPTAQFIGESYPETPKMAMAERTSDHESDDRFGVGKPGFPFVFPSNHTSISLSFGDISV